MEWLILMIVVVGFLGGAASGVCSYLHFDSLLRVFYREHEEEWRKSGTPIGFFFCPPNAKMWDGSFARGQLIHNWIKIPPPWITRSPELQQIHYRMRLWQRFSTVGLCVFIGSLITGSIILLLP
jgi:hypothetical protein